MTVGTHRRFGTSAVTTFASLALVLSSFLCAQTALGSQSQAGAESSSGCSLNGKTYICNLEQFLRSFRRTKTVALENAPRDRAAEKQLHELAATLGKSVVPNAQADAYLVLLPADNNSVTFGPADSDLATLRVYAANPEGSRGQLLWSETYRGQDDRPWPLVVRALVLQFEDRFKSH